MPANATRDATTPYACPTCSGPLVAEEVPGGADWATLFCPECRASHKWRGTGIGIGMRVFAIVLVTADWVLMVVDAGWRDDTFRQILAVAGLGAFVWAAVGLVRMTRTASGWRHSL